jgi:hypothetical protein
MPRDAVLVLVENGPNQPPAAAKSNCATAMPELRPFDAGRSVACHYPEGVVRAEAATAA